MEAKLGNGKRFSKLMEKLKKQHGIKNPAALAAHIGREKFGNKKMNSLALKGRERKGK